MDFDEQYPKWMNRLPPELTDAVRQAQATFPKFRAMLEQDRCNHELNSINKPDDATIVEMLVDIFNESLAGHLPPEIEVAKILFFLPDDSDETTGVFKWLFDPFDIEGRKITGTRIDLPDTTNDPNSDRYTIDESQIADWVIVLSDDTIMGKFISEDL